MLAPKDSRLAVALLVTLGTVDVRGQAGAPGGSPLRTATPADSRAARPAAAPAAGPDADDTPAEALRKLGGAVEDFDPKAGRTEDVVHFWDNPKLTDADLRAAAGALRRLPKLRVLMLDFTRVTDAGLAHLKGLPGVEVLTLKATRVTDAGLARLAGLPALKEVDLTLTSVTAEGVAAFRKARRGVNVTASGAGEPAAAAALRGRWRATAVTQGGKPDPDPAAHTLVVAGNDLGFFYGGGRLLFLTRYSVDSAAAPKRIDLTVTAVAPGFNSRTKAESIKGVYQINGDTLTLALGELDGGRPADVSWRAARRYVFRREKE